MIMKMIVIVILIKFANDNDCRYHSRFHSSNHMKLQSEVVQIAQIVISEPGPYWAYGGRINGLRR